MHESVYLDDPSGRPDENGPMACGWQCAVQRKNEKLRFVAQRVARRFEVFLHGPDVVQAVQEHEDGPVRRFDVARALLAWSVGHKRERKGDELYQVVLAGPVRQGRRYPASNVTLGRFRCLHITNRKPANPAAAMILSTFAAVR